MLLAVLAAVWFGVRTSPHTPPLAEPAVAASAPPISAAPATAPAAGLLNPFGVDPLYLLLVGTDADVTAGRTDTMIVLAASFRRQAVALLSIPRDTRIELAGRGAEKINAAFPVGGRDLSCQAVANLIQKPIHQFLHCDLQAFQAMVDALGGVTVDVDRRMSYRDRAQNLHIDLQPGTQRLDGEHAMQYVRFRKDKLGDLGRIQRQQKFLKAVAKELANPANLTRLPAVLQAVNNNLDTTLTVPQLLYLAKMIASVGVDGIAMGQLPGEARYLHGISYYLAAPDAPVAVDQLLAASSSGVAAETRTSGLPAAVTIYNGSDRLGLEQLVAEQLTTQGFLAQSAAPLTSQAVEDSRVYAVDLADQALATRLGGRLGVTASSNAAPAAYPPLAQAADRPQLVLVLGRDFQPPR